MKELIIFTFGPHCDNVTYTFMYNLLDHIVEGIQEMGNTSMLEASPYKHFNVFIKNSYRSTSKRITTVWMKL